VNNSTTLDATTSQATDAQDREAAVAMLVLAWSSTEPARIGEVIIPTDRPAAFGRGDGEPGETRAVLVRQRPGHDQPTPALDNPFLSRRHLLLRATGAGIAVENLGKKALLHDGQPAETKVTVHDGETLEIPGQALFLCVRRARTIAPCPSVPEREVRGFGEPDDHGLVGESPLAWQLRERCALVGGLSAHVLLLGDSGTGKELAAQAIHARSTRAKRPLVARNAVTFPPGLIDAELFGNIAGYPNPGMPARPGIIGEADGTTLFLDEIAEMPHELQSHLLRVLDGGEYNRLGEATRRRADLRVIAATNRDALALKHDLAARLGLRITLPPLDARREDIPLIARYLLNTIARKDPQIGARFFASWNGKTGEPRLAPALVRELLAHHYKTNVRELEALLLSSLVGSRGATLELTDELVAELRPTVRIATPVCTAEQVRAALDKHGGVRELAWRELGLANRYVLKRLMKKHGIADAED
jgi:two-component system nitrogen regulation response regulator GlnG/two-component system response regulator HydG